MTEKEALQKLLDEQIDRLVRLEVNVEYYTRLLKDKPEDEDFIKQEARYKILVPRQKKLIEVIEERLKKHE